MNSITEGPRGTKILAASAETVVHEADKVWKEVAGLSLT